MKHPVEITCDETLNGHLNMLEAGKDEDGPVNRLLKIHEAAEAELRNLEADFQSRLEESILQMEFQFAEKLAAAKQEFQRREQEIQETADQRLQKATEEFDAERKEFQKRIAALGEDNAGSKKTAQPVIRTPLSRQLETQLEELAREKARLEAELNDVHHRHKAEGHRLEKLKTSKALPQVWEL